MTKRKLKPHFGKLSIILLVVIAVLIAADLLTKHFEEAYVWTSNGPVLGGLIDIKGTRNAGCAFSFLDDNPQIGQPLLITVTALLLIVMVFGFVVMPNRFVLLKVAISLVIAGAIGNLVDRIAFFYVRDWFGLWMFGNIAYCNFADFWIVIGAILAAVDMLFINEIAVFPLTKKAKEFQAARREEEERKKAETASTDSVSAEEPVGLQQNEVTEIKDQTEDENK